MAPMPNSILTIVAIATAMQASAAFAPVASQTGSTAGQARTHASLQVAKRSTPPEVTAVDEDDGDFYDGYDPSAPVNIRSEPPPEFTILDEDDDNDNDDDDDDDDDSYVPAPVKRSYDAPPKASTSAPVRRPPPRKVRPVRPSLRKKEDENMVGTSWMQKNQKFATPVQLVQQQQQKDAREEIRQRRPSRDDSRPRDPDFDDRPPRASRSFTPGGTDTFRSTRVFVQGIPEGTSWQDLKDHFRDHIEDSKVVFASVSVDVETGRSKNHGIVQFETPEMAQAAISNMRFFPLNESPLYVREDVQEASSGPTTHRTVDDQRRGSRRPQKWTCANQDNAAYLSDAEKSNIEERIKERDDARRNKKFDISDRIRDELKQELGVFIDDRLKLWWTSVDGRSVPQSIHDIKGEGGWGTRKTEWRQIPTTPENDACIDPDLVEGLLKQRDAARREKDFPTADRLLEQARTSPDGELSLRIHDESRTWRIWTDAPPPGSTSSRDNNSERWGNRRDDDSHSSGRYNDDDDDDDALDSALENSMGENVVDNREAKSKSAAQQCLNIVRAYDPEKVGEMETVLSKFPGREYNILKRVKKQYLES